MKPLTILLFFGLWLSPWSATAQNDDFKMLEWNGGTVQADLQLGLNMAGTGIGAGTMGGVVSSRINSGATSLFANPTALSRLTAPQLTFGTKFRLGLATFGLGSDTFLSTETIAEETDGFLNDLDFPAGGIPQYTDIDRLQAAQVGQMASFALAFPVYKRLVLGIGLHQPLDVALDVRVSGVEAFLEASQQSDDQTIDINVLLNFSAGVGLKLNMNTLSFGMGSVLAEGRLGRLSAGLALNRYQVTNAVRWNINPQGIVVLSRSQEYFFNDPDDPNLNPELGETNQFFWRAQGTYKDSAWGARGGLSYTVPSERLNLSILYNHIPPFTLTDPNAFAESYLPAFANLDGKIDPAEGEEELLDVSALSLAKPNLTQATGDSLGQVMTFKMPSSLTLGLDVALGKHTLAFNYIQYFGELSYAGVFGDRGGEADPFLVGKSLSSGFRLGLDVAFPDRLQGVGWALLPIRLLFLDLDGLLLQALGKHTGYRNPHYRVGGGLLFGEALLEEVTPGFQNDVQDLLDTPLPTGFTLGRQYTVLNDLDVGVMVFSLPDMVFRVALAYNFR